MIKWIGQHIWDFTSRFRADVYFDTLSSTKNNQVLLLDANEKVTTLDQFLFMPNTTAPYGIIAGEGLGDAGVLGHAMLMGGDDNVTFDITRQNHGDGGGGKLRIWAGSATATASGDNANGGYLFLNSGRGTGAGESHVYITTSTTIAGTASALQTASTTWDFWGKVHSNPYALLEVDDDFALLAKGNMMFGIDSDVNETGQGWSWNNNAQYGGGTSVMTLNEGGDLQIDGDLTVDGGDITLGGTGRIQGIDTVTDSTDAASKAYVDGAVGGGLSFDGSTANGLLTYKDADEIAVESNATYDGADLTLTSATSTKPILSIENTTHDANAGELKLIGRRSADASVIAGAGDDAGTISFIGENAKSGPDPETIPYGKIASESSTVTDGAEMGKMTMSVGHNGSAIGGSLGFLDFMSSTASVMGETTTYGSGSLLSMTSFNSTITDFQSTASTAPIMTIRNYTNDATGPSLTLQNSRGGSSLNVPNVNGDDLGTIKFIGFDSNAASAAGITTTFAQILGEANEITNGSEEGKLTLSVASHDAEMQPGLTIVSGNAEDEVDATIGNGATSIVTVPGNISIGGHSINDIDVAGEFVDSDEHLMTSAAINDRIAAVGGGGSSTSYWHQMVGGYKTGWNSSSNYYTFYRFWFENWSNNDSSPETISYSDYYAHVFIAPRAGTVTNIKISGVTTGSSYADPFKFYFYKAGSSSNASSVSLTSMFSTSSITPPGTSKTWSHTEDFSSNNTFVEDDRIYVWVKKDSNSGSTSSYWTININGEYS